MSSQLPGSNTRFDALDSWRGLGSLLVVYTHLCLEWNLPKPPIVQSSFLFVDFFFVLSGFVISYVYGGRLENSRAYALFMLRRLGRLWPLHLTVLALFVAIIATKLAVSPDSAVMNMRFSGAGIVTSLFMVNGLGVHGSVIWNRPTWSISAEFWTYTVFGLAFLTAGLWRKALILAVGGIGVGGLITFTPDFMNVTYDYGLFRCLYGFAAGCVAYWLWLAVPFGGGFLTATTLEAVAAALMTAALCLPRRESIHMIVPVMFIGMIWIFAQEAGGVSRLLRVKPLVRLGHWSYGIYLIHDLIIYLINDLVRLGSRAGVVSWGSVAGAPGWSKTMFVLVCTAAAIALSALSYRFIEMPGLRFFTALGARARKPLPAESMLERRS